MTVNGLSILLTGLLAYGPGAPARPREVLDWTQAPHRMTLDTELEAAIRRVYQRTREAGCGDPVVVVVTPHGLTGYALVVEGFCAEGLPRSPGGPHP